LTRHWAAGTAALLDTVCFYSPGDFRPHFHKEIFMDWDTALRRELKRFNAAARHAIAKREAGEVASKPSKPQPTTWNEALKRVLRKARRKAARSLRAGASQTKHVHVNAK
jgi:hypothetical protein